MSPASALDPVALVHALTGVLRSFAEGTADQPSGVRLDDEQRVALVEALREVTSAASAATLRAYADHDAARRRSAAARGARAAEQGRGIARELGLASHLSHHAAKRRLAVAKLATTEMPHAFDRLTDGTLDEKDVVMLVQQTASVEREVREAVDRELCADSTVLEGLGQRRLEAEAVRIVQRRDPAGAAARAAKAARDRHVSSRPAPDTMVRVSALLPVQQGVAVIAALRQAAAAAHAAGDHRTRGQVMADALVERVTGQATAAAVPLAIGLLVRAGTVFDAETVTGNGTAAADANTAAAADLTEPSWLLGHGPLDALTTRDLLRAALDDDQARARSWLRRLWTDPATGALVAMDSRRRTVPGGLASFVHARDLGLCRTPWCDAPARHTDHVNPVAAGGATAEANLQALCEACNYAKEADAWHHTVPDPRSAVDRASPHHVEVTTPTGRRHRSRPPHPPGTPPPAPDRRRRGPTCYVYVGGPPMVWEPAA